MKKFALIACAAMSATISGALAADTLDYPKQAYDATYTSTGPMGSSTTRMVTDGKGHMRVESSAGGQKVVSISDYPAKTSWSIMETQKMIMKLPLKASAGSYDAESAKKAGAKDLGSKVVNGHPSHGWESTSEGGKAQTWIADDIHCLVKSETTTPQGKITMELKQYNGGAPSADLFKVPTTGYKTMNLPGS